MLPSEILNAPIRIFSSFWDNYWIDSTDYFISKIIMNFNIIIKFIVKYSSLKIFFNSTMSNSWLWLRQKCRIIYFASKFTHLILRNITNSRVTTEIKSSCTRHKYCHTSSEMGILLIKLRSIASCCTQDLLSRKDLGTLMEIPIWIQFF